MHEHVFGLHRMTAILQKDPLNWLLVRKFGLIPLEKWQVMKYRKHGPCVIAEINDDYICLRLKLSWVWWKQRIRNNMMRKWGTRRKMALKPQGGQQLWTWRRNKISIMVFKYGPLRISEEHSLTENLKC